MDRERVQCGNRLGRPRNKGHPYLIVGAWFGYLHSKFIDSQNATGPRIQAALAAGVLTGLCVFAASLVFVSCT
jgi:hypothetical protein